LLYGYLPIIYFNTLDSFSNIAIPTQHPTINGNDIGIKMIV